ncbi:hypothetical protein [Streptomyces sp. ME18-1-4]|nr:hypothetical protein [Streptomyces sp. ME18-1-4]MDX3244933.1 hypothetical protein [Streptomyces sp. ME18-1-4]
MPPTGPTVVGAGNLGWLSGRTTAAALTADRPLPDPPAWPLPQAPGWG